MDLVGLGLARSGLRLRLGPGLGDGHAPLTLGELGHLCREDPTGRATLLANVTTSTSHGDCEDEANGCLAKNLARTHP